MANKKAAMKALRQSKKLQDKNAKVKDNIKWLTKKVEKAVGEKSADALELIKKLAKAVDKAVIKKIIKANTGRRKKSRLMKKYNAAFGVGKQK